MGQLIGAFKTVSTKRINALRENPGDVIWQRGFHERVIRAGSELARVRHYINENPIDWREDAENPINWIEDTENPINWSEDAENPAHGDEENPAHLAVPSGAPCRDG